MRFLCQITAYSDYNQCMDNDDAIAFIKEREEKLGGKILYRTYSTWYGRIGKEKREYGVFLYTDGKVFVYEDFERNPMIMGIPLPVKNKEKYVKMEHSFPVSSIVSIERVLRSDAERSVKLGSDFTKAPGLFGKAFRKLVTKVTLKDGSILFFEFMDHMEFVRIIQKFMEENRE